MKPVPSWQYGVNINPQHGGTVCILHPYNPFTIESLTLNFGI
jgi:hypothetical protein